MMVPCDGGPFDVGGLDACSRDVCVSESDRCPDDPDKIAPVSNNYLHGAYSYNLHRGGAGRFDGECRRQLTDETAGFDAVPDKHQVAFLLDYALAYVLSRTTWARKLAFSAKTCSPRDGKLSIG